MIVSERMFECNPKRDDLQKEEEVEVDQKSKGGAAHELPVRRSLTLRKVNVAAGFTVVCLALLLLYPVGGSIWSDNQVSGLAMVQGGHRVELQNPNMLAAAARDALFEARVSRLRRWLPGKRCRPLELQFLAGGRWVVVPVPCASGLLFDFIPREAWR